MGKHHIEETKQKIREYRIGKVPWNKGKTGVYSEETIKQMKKSHSNYWVGRTLSKDHREKIGIGNTGKKRSEETKRQISNTLKEWYRQKQETKNLT